MLFASLLLFAGLVLAIRAKRELLPFFSIFLASAAYYGLVGPLYWLDSEDGRFAGVNWSDLIPEASAFVCGATLLIILTTYLSALFVKLRHTNTYVVKARSKFLLPMLSISMLSAAAVFATASSRGSLFLVAYQFSDLAIPCLVYFYATSKRKSLTTGAVLLFILYTIFVGFRYKTVLIVTPILLIYAAELSAKKRIIFGLIAIPIVLAGLSIMTIVRVKFSGVSSEALSNVSTDKFIYGLFAESNTIFGMCSIIETYLNTNTVVWFDPIVDSFLELIPKALMPDRVTGDRIFVVLAGLGTNEGFNSHTTYPFVGEMVMMGGYFGMILGCFAVSLVLIWLHVRTAQWASTKRIYNGGIGLISIVFGYYFVSRGYMPQFVKAVLFVAVPYLLLMVTTRKTFIATIT